MPFTPLKGILVIGFIKKKNYRIFSPPTCSSLAHKTTLTFISTLWVRKGTCIANATLSQCLSNAEVFRKRIKILA